VLGIKKGANMGCYDYGILFKRALNNEVIGLIEFYNQGVYNLNEYPRGWLTKDANLFKENLWNITHSFLLAGKIIHNLSNDFISKRAFVKELLRIVKLVNSHEFKYQESELIAYPVVFREALSSNIFPYFKKPQKYENYWTYAFLNDKRFNFKAYKCLGYTSLFSCDQDLYDVVNREEFCKIDDRLPLFMGTMCGRFPYLDELPGFFNGDKYMGVIGKSLLSGTVFGLSIYHIPHTTKSVGRNSTAGMEKIASY
jgi:hypothetical protein